ncbi:glutathione peroxidase [bacterium]|nr:glutathione peroxidase [bacterium]
MTTAHAFSFKSIDGSSLSMKDFADKAVLVVNVASKCGLTPQYSGLERLYTRYRDQGLVVLGVPCNQFLGQEPGTEEQIQTFCSTTYGVDFPLTAKNDVKGKSAHPFFTWAVETLGKDAKPGWNFHKILVGKQGEPLATFGSRMDPEDSKIVRAIEEAISA